ncbi:HAD family hydrolase [Polycladidibacter hongkongensis]|uniref:HAD family hydrolase n=1 Tax=Polycladidibacter hongkongensis TaxID=1647556 RepID=UPI00082B7F57|nr:HAD family hydrolase [Pseudovibrio hongkongensis]
MTIKAFLFDRDGTLTDFDRTWGPAIHHLIIHLSGGDVKQQHRLGTLLGFDTITGAFMEGSPFKTQPPSQYLGTWAKELGRVDDPTFLPEVEDRLLQYSVQEVTPFDDTIVTLTALKRAGIPFGLATNGTVATARRQLEHLGILQDFEFVVGYDSGFGAKPEPGQLIAFAKQLQLRPEEIAMVGDSLHDMHAAEAAGMVRVAVSTGACTVEELLPNSDHLFSSLSQIVQLLPHAEMHTAISA